MANEILVTRGLTKRYGNHLAVDHVELSIQKGQIYGLVGRNGAGKTTIIRMVTAQTVPTEAPPGNGSCPKCGPAPGPWWRRPASIPT